MMDINLEKIDDIFIYEKYYFEKSREFYDTIKIDRHINMRNKKMI